MTATTTNSATGRRKTAVARVWMTEGTGQITINDRPFEEYLPTVELQNAILAPFQAPRSMNKFDLKVVVKGGGTHAQADRHPPRDLPLAHPGGPGKPQDHQAARLPDPRSRA